MAQIRDTRYHSPDTSAVQNRQLASIVAPGVYAGYKLTVNASAANQLDITAGGDISSVLVTSEGVRVEETTTIVGAVVIGSPDPSNDRIDTVVAEYAFTTDNSVEQAYKVIPGTPAANPVPATITSATQVPLAYVRVKAGTSQAAITVKEITHVQPAAGLRAPLDVSSMAMIPAPGDPSRVYVYGGQFPSRDGSQVIEFGGSVSDSLPVGSSSSGDTLWYLIGVSDGGSVVVMGSAATREALPPLNDENLVVGAVRAQNTSGTMAVQEVVDYRFILARDLRPTIEEEPYKSALADSVFKHLRVDLFRDDSMLDLTTISDASVKAEIDQGDSSLKLTYSGSTQPAADVTIATKDTLSGTTIERIQHVMVLASASIPGITYDVSTTSASQGFTATKSGMGSILRIPSGPASKVFIKFTIPASALTAGSSVKIFSYGVFLGLDDRALQAVKEEDSNVRAQSAPNLIANGNFRYWSRNDSSGNTPNPDVQSAISYSVSESSPYAADGWQFTQFAYQGSVGRVGLSKDVVAASSITNPGDTALSWSGDGGGTATNILEYRVPVPAGLDQFITFGCRYKSNIVGNVSVAVVLYERSASGGLVAQGEVKRSSAITSEGDLIATSSIAVSEATVAAGFRVYLTQATGATQVYLWNARAAYGVFRQLPYSEPVGSLDLLRQYYERGRLYSTTTADEADTIGVSTQFGGRKLSVLGDVRGQVVPGASANRSLNISVPSVTVDRDSLLVAASVISTGLVRVDVDFEAFVHYTTAS